MLLGFGVDVTEDVDVREVDSEPAEQRGHPGHIDKVCTCKYSDMHINVGTGGRAAADSRAAVMVDAVDLSADEDADPAVTPLTPVGQQVGNEQRQACKHRSQVIGHRCCCSSFKMEQKSVFHSKSFKTKS